MRGLGARLGEGFGAIAVPVLLVYARIVEGLLVSDHQLTLTRVFGLQWDVTSASQGPFVNLEHWDAGWYSSIALHGYASKPDAAFYPGYPLLSALVHDVSFGWVSLPVALFFVAWGALLGFALVFVRLCRRLGLGSSLGVVALFAVLFSPGSCFLISWYPLSLYLLLSSVAFLMLFAGREWVSSLAAGAASSLSPVAVAVSIALSVRFLFRDRSRPLSTRLAQSALSFWGIVGYVAFCQVRYGSLLEPLKAQAHWYVRSIVPFSYLPTMLYSLLVDHFSRSLVANFGINLLCQLLALVLIVRILVDWFKGKVKGDLWTFSLFTILSLVIPASTVVPYGPTFRAEGFARLSGASVGFNVELARGIRGLAVLWVFVPLWFFLGLVGQILFSGGWFT